MMSPLSASLQSIPSIYPIQYIPTTNKNNLLSTQDTAIKKHIVTGTSAASWREMKNYFRLDFFTSLNGFYYQNPRNTQANKVICMPIIIYKLPISLVQSIFQSTRLCLMSSDIKNL